MSILTVIMKVTNNCNMRCRHCYNSNKTSNNSFMTSQVLEETIKLALNSDYDTVSFIWHGGEPMLFSIEKYAEAIAFQKKYNTNKKIINGIQTNGSLLNQKNDKFFYDNNFHISISYDGIYNNVLREKTEVVEKVINKYLKENRRFSIISTVCSSSIENIEKTYEDLKNKGFTSWKFNPIFKSGRAETNQEYLIDPEVYIRKMKEFMNYYVFDLNGTMNVSTLDNYLYMVTDKAIRGCENSSCMFKFISFDPDGDIYPCGRYYPREYSIGNVSNFSNMDEVFNSPGYNNLVSLAIERRDNCQKKCQYYKYCNGGCNNFAILYKDMLHQNPNECLILKSIVDYTSELVNDIKLKNNDINPRIQRIIFG